MSTLKERINRKSLNIIIKGYGHQKVAYYSWKTSLSLRAAVSARAHTHLQQAYKPEEINFLSPPLFCVASENLLEKDNCCLLHTRIVAVGDSPRRVHATPRREINTPPLIGPSAESRENVRVEIPVSTTRRG